MRSRSGFTFVWKACIDLIEERGLRGMEREWGSVGLGSEFVDWKRRDFVHGEEEVRIGDRKWNEAK